MALSEFEIIRRFFTSRARSAVLGVGDDAAIVRARRGFDLVVTTDLLAAGRHFRHDADPRGIGHKALAVNLSDVAAMGGQPRWATLALALPGADARWLAGFSRGFMRLARRHGVDLIGGDTTRGPLAICVQLIGEVPAGHALRRDGARAGDDVWVSGHLGDAALLLAATAGRVPLSARERARLAPRLHTPVPRVSLGIALRGLAGSAIDISDGLLSDLGHVCERSGVGAVVDLAQIPCSATMRRHLSRAPARAALLSGGDDYELCFTARRRERERIARVACRQRLPVTRIGRIVPAKSGAAQVTVVDRDGRALTLKQKGFDHFG
ncbi:MAG TPA: thiamine-phosphate kinase [Burkholderiales bacterium]|nr:thiamine-phosphate kinase [Burkholderiales bacterium]